MLVVFEDFVVENWGRPVLEDLFRVAGVGSARGNRDERVKYLLAELNLPIMLTRLASDQRLELNDLLYAFGKFSFPHIASRVPRNDPACDHPKQFLMAINRLLSMEPLKGGLVQFRYVDCGPEELLMMCAIQQSFSSFVEGFVGGMAESFAHRIECRPMLDQQKTEPTGCDFHLTFRGQL